MKGGWKGCTIFWYSLSKNYKNNNRRGRNHFRENHLVSAGIFQENGWCSRVLVVIIFTLLCQSMEVGHVLLGGAEIRLMLPITLPIEQTFSRWKRRASQIKEHEAWRKLLSKIQSQKIYNSKFTNLNISIYLFPREIIFFF